MGRNLTFKITKGQILNLDDNGMQMSKPNNGSVNAFKQNSIGNCRFYIVFIIM